MRARNRDAICGRLLSAVGLLLALAAPAGAVCGGDCSGDGTVAINELITGVNVALGSAELEQCASFDASGDGVVAINELIAAVGNAQNGCAVEPADTPTLPPGTVTAAISPGTPTATPTSTPTPTTQRARLLRTGQTTSYGPGSDGALQKGVSRSFTDNGDGTITDNVTGLMWEKKSYDRSIHNLEDIYDWGMSASPYAMNGTMVTDFLAALNAGDGFAGHTDWRIPNRFELDSLVAAENVSPATYPVFNVGCVLGCTVTTCSCTRPGVYWSSTSYFHSLDDAWGVNFFDGLVSVNSKNADRYVRAVRGGS